MNMRNAISGVYFKGEESFNFNFYTNLMVSDKLEFVNSIVDLVVDGQNYNYVIRDLLFDFYLIDIMTDVDTSELVSSESFLYDVELFLENTSIVDVVKANIDTGLIEELNKAIDLNIEYRTGMRVNQLNDALTSLVNTIEKKMDGIDLNKAMEMVNLFTGMTDEFTTENIVKAYNSISNSK